LKGPPVEAELADDGAHGGFSQGIELARGNFRCKDGNVRVLVVSRSEPERTTICAGLRSFGFEVIEATTAGEAVACADGAGGSLGAVVSALTLGRQDQEDGFSVLAFVRKRHPGALRVLCVGQVVACLEPVILAEGTAQHVVIWPFDLAKLGAWLKPCRSSVNVSSVLSGGAGHHHHLSR
jgi:DNA-binding response OmpR family regulator